MATQPTAGQGGIYEGNQQVLGIYQLGDGTNGFRNDIYANVEARTVWAAASSGSLTFQNPSEYLTATVLTASKNVGITINNNAAAVTDGSASMSLVLAPGIITTIPVRGVKNINLIASSGSALVSFANYY